MPELRTTTGQRVEIRYDARTNALIFFETDWFAEPLRSSGVPARSAAVRPLAAGTVARPRPGRRVRRAA